jgi:hypothetical protein
LQGLVKRKYTLKGKVEREREYQSKGVVLLYTRYGDPTLLPSASDRDRSLDILPGRAGTVGPSPFATCICL